MIGIILFIVLTSLYVLSVIGGILYFKKGYFKKFYHDVLHYHVPKENEVTYIYKGCPSYSFCKYCGKEILEDSQGNWFER